jgi:hypothetical protein
MTDKELLERIQQRIGRNPAIVPDVLDAVRNGMKAWEASVQRRLDHRADMAISAALLLPTQRHWSTDNESHRSMMRLVAVGWNLARRVAGSPLEKAVVAFVREGDRVDPDSAEQHYKIIESAPVVDQEL